MLNRESVNRAWFNHDLNLPYQLRLADFEIAMQDVYDFFFDVNTLFRNKGLLRLDDMLRPANLSGTLSDMMTASMAAHSRTLVQNEFHNGHPDLIVQGVYPNNKIKSGSEGVEIKTTRKRGGSVDTHGGRDQWMCVFVYEIDGITEPAQDRQPLLFTEVYLSKVVVGEFRENPRGPLGTRTATLDRNGIRQLRNNWVYRRQAG